MPTLTKKVWGLPNGTEYVTFHVDWRENGHPRRKPFSNCAEATDFLATLTQRLRTRRPNRIVPSAVQKTLHVSIRR